MKHKKRIGKRLLGFTLTLAMVFGMISGIMPGTVMTAMALPDMGSTHTHDGITFTAWNSSNSLPAGGDGPDQFYLTQDVTLSSTWEVPNDTDYHLCLNGHSITYSGTNGSVIKVGNEATLNLYDCDTTTTHKYTITDGLAVLSNSGDKSFTGGYIAGGKSDESYLEESGHGIYIEGGTFNMYGGTIIGNSAEYFGGGVCVDGYIGSGESHPGSFMMGNDAQIIGNKANGGGGVYIYYGCTFTMSGGCISENTGVGGGVESLGTFIMSGGRIADNVSETIGGGIEVGQDSTFIMSGGSVTGNTSVQGGGVYVSGGYDAGGYHTDPGIFNVSGDVAITDNKQVLDETVTDSNVQLNRASSSVYSVITFTDTLSSAARIGLTLAEGYPGAFTSGFNGKGSISNFTTDGDYVVSENSSHELELVPAHSVKIFDSTNGKVTASPSKALENSTITLTVTPDSGYQLSSINAERGITFAELVQAMGTAGFTGKYNNEDYICKVSSEGEAYMKVEQTGVEYPASYTLLLCIDICQPLNF